MTAQNILLSNWNSGVVMIGIFGLVCLFLIGSLVKSMISNDRKNDETTK